MYKVERESKKSNFYKKKNPGFLLLLLLFSMLGADGF
jgi:hypothetical protein